MIFKNDRPNPRSSILRSIILGSLILGSLVGSRAEAQVAFGLGGTSGDSGQAMALDAAGNIYLTGYFNGTVDFDPGPGVYALSTGLDEAVYIVSYDVGGALRYAISFSGEGRDIGVDADGNVFVTGLLGSGAVDVDPGPDAVLLDRAEGKIFLVSYGPTGDLRFGFNVGGGISNKVEEGRGLALDDQGNVYLTGVFNDACDFDPTEEGEKQVPFAGITDAFLASYDGSGGVRFAFALGSRFADEGLAVDVDAAGNSTVVGAYRDTMDVDPGPDVVNIIPNGQRDWFLAGYTALGGYRFAIGVGGTSDEVATAVAQDAAGNAYVTGWFQNQADFDPGPASLLLTSAGQRDCYLASYDDEGDLRFAFRLGNAQPMIGYGVAVDAQGRPHLTGAFNNFVDFDPGPGEQIRDGSNDAFIAGYTATGEFRYATYFEDVGLELTDQGNDILVDAGGAIHLTGSFRGTCDFDPGPGTLEVTSNGNDDAFYYRGSSGLSSVDTTPGSAAAYTLSPAHPNPFNPRTTLAFTMADPGRASVRIYDVQGRFVRTLAEGVLAAGTHRRTWRGIDARGRSVGSGVYLARFEYPGGSSNSRLVLLK